MHRIDLQAAASDLSIPRDLIADPWAYAAISVLIAGDGAESRATRLLSLVERVRLASGSATVRARVSRWATAATDRAWQVARDICDARTAVYPYAPLARLDGGAR